MTLVFDHDKIPFQLLMAENRKELIARLEISDIDTILVALTVIAAFTDSGGNKYLRKSDRYSAFDEPYSVRIARVALEQILKEEK